MCGLVGFLSFERPVERARGQRIVRDMAKALDYRGPDMDGYWSSADERCHLGHKRLAIIDLTEAGRQPMLDDTGRYVIVFNGEIYNFQELRDRLASAGVAFRSKSDTEVLLKGYIAHGNAWFAQLDGQFALAIYDTEARTMVLARDRAGEKPLYYRATQDLFLFGSELHALTKMPDLQWEMSPTAIALYMLYRYVPAPHSILEGVRKLKPGCLMTVDPTGQIQEQRYYAFEVDPQVGASQEDFLKTCDRVEAAMIESLRRRLISDVPVGMFLSSGIDSSLICALTKKLGVTPRTFTIGFEGDEGSEHETARAIATHLGTQHTEHVFGSSDFDSVGRRIGSLMDEPNGDRSCVPTYLLCKFAREQVTVALSGDGGDELFGGYGRYGLMQKQFSKPEDIDPRKAIGFYYNSALPVFGLPPIHRALPDTAATLDAELDVSLPLFQHPARNVVHGLRQMDFAYYMPGAVLAKVDRMSMRSSLETRTPFFEMSLLNEATRLPTAYCIDPTNDRKKLVLREIAGRHLPREVALLPKKGFGMPASVFLNNAKAVQQEVRNAFETLAATRFFSGRGTALKTMQAAAENINAAWAFIVLGQWAAHFPVRL